MAQALIGSGFRVIAADLRGHGDSDANFLSYGDEDTARDLIALLEHLGAVATAGPVLLVGGRERAAALSDLLCRPGYWSAFRATTVMTNIVRNATRLSRWARPTGASPMITPASIH
ncbi:alpha/beta fold hydrolase [Actinomyces slackii]|uniref:alpha/beta fold hydrolase n=1 Tax=Actinomyces slackii TaxID=52774 RepID=UPI0009FE74EC|nr:alpha/beta fold hydrolase [Actinomyces slackii]